MLPNPSYGGAYLSNRVCNRSTASYPHFRARGATIDRDHPDRELLTYDEDTGMSNATRRSNVYPDRPYPEHLRSVGSGAPSCTRMGVVPLSSTITPRHSIACTIRGAPSVSPKWADMAHKSRADMSTEELQLLESVQAECLFSDGLGDRGAVNH